MWLYDQPDCEWIGSACQVPDRQPAALLGRVLPTIRAFRSADLARAWLAVQAQLDGNATQTTCVTWWFVRRYIAAMRAGSAAGWQYLLRLGPMLGPMLGPEGRTGTSRGSFRLTRSAPAAPDQPQPLCSLHRHPFPLRVCLLEL